MSKLGGTQHKLQLQKWRNEDSVWGFQIITRQTITKFVQQKRKAKEHLNDEMKKWIKLQSDVKQLKGETAFWRKVTTKQAKTVVSLKTGCSEGTRGSSTKPWGEYSRQHRYIKKKTLGKTVQAALSVINIGCYKPVAVQFENMETNKKETFNNNRWNFFWTGSKRKHNNGWQD